MAIIYVVNADMTEVRELKGKRKQPTPVQELFRLEKEGWSEINYEQWRAMKAVIARRQKEAEEA